MNTFTLHNILNLNNEYKKIKYYKYEGTTKYFFPKFQKRFNRIPSVELKKKCL